MGTKATGLSGLVTVDTASRILGVTANAVLHRIHRYQVPVVLIGRCFLVSLADLRSTYQRKEPV